MIDYDEITIELSMIERRAYQRVRERAASQQLGEGWIDLFDEVSLAPSEYRTHPRRLRKCG